MFHQRGDGETDNHAYYLIPDKNGISCRFTITSVLAFFTTLSTKVVKYLCLYVSRKDYTGIQAHIVRRIVLIGEKSVKLHYVFSKKFYFN